MKIVFDIPEKIVRKAILSIMSEDENIPNRFLDETLLVDEVMFKPEDFNKILDKEEMEQFLGEVTQLAVGMMSLKYTEETE